MGEPARDEVAVVGAGIAGASVAFHLSRLGASATVYERGDVGGATTARSAAFFGTYGTPLERRMKRYGMQVYNDLVGEADADHRYEHVGRVRVATTADGASALRGFADADAVVRVLDPEEIHAEVLIPDLTADAVELATYRPHVGYFRPRPLALALADRAAERDGIAIRERTAVERVLLDEDGAATGVVVDGERVPTDHVIAAAGPWNASLLSEAGLELPLAHSLAPVLRVDLGEQGYTLPIVTHHETGVYARGDEEGTALLGRYPPDPDLDARFEPDEVPDEVPGDLRGTIRDEIGRLLPAVADAPLLEEWVGVRSHTPDGHPIAGEVADGLSIAAFDSSGIQLGPAVGRTIARGVAGEDDEFGAELAPDRFA